MPVPVLHPSVLARCMYNNNKRMHAHFFCHLVYLRSLSVLLSTEGKLEGSPLGIRSVQVNKSRGDPWNRQTFGFLGQDTPRVPPWIMRHLDLRTRNVYSVLRSAGASTDEHPEANTRTILVHVKDR